MKRNTITKRPVNDSDVNKRLNETLFQFFYLFGIEPDSLNISDISNISTILEPHYLKDELLTKYPPFGRSQANINPYIIMNHCFPNGYNLICNEKNPDDEFFYFNLDNLFSFLPENQKIYFVCAIIYEPIKKYLSIKYKNNDLKLSSFKIEEQKENISIDTIYVPKALCLSSFVSFPYEIKLILVDLLNYIRSDKITIPIEKILESIVFGIPRPLRAHFYLSFNKIIPRQSKDIYFILREFNQYKFSSYSFQLIFRFVPTSIISIYRCILTEVPVLFFSKNKEILTNTVESFLSLIYPFEYQYPHISILPDSNAGLIEIEKCFVFGINREFSFVKNEKESYLTYFKEMKLNLPNKPILICDIDSGKISSFCLEYDKFNYHIVKFEDLGIYNSGNIDPSQCISKDAYTDKLSIIHKIFLPKNYTDKLKSKLEEYQKDKNSKNCEYGLNNNTKIGEDYFHYYLARILLTYNNYMFNGEEEVKKICEEILTKGEDEINIENLFKIEQFLHDNSDPDFYNMFFRTKIFKHFIIKKYLNEPLERYKYLLFDEKIILKKNKKKFSKKYETKFTSSKSFQSTRTYQVKPPTDFTEEEKSIINQNKDILLYKYYQKVDKDNNIKYILFPKLIYDNKFFKKEYKPCTSLIGDNNLYNYLREYQAIEDSLKIDVFQDFFSIYNEDIFHRYLINIDKFQYNREMKNSIYFVWVIAFCLTFYYCNEKEKYFRIEELIRFLKEVDDKEKYLPILLLTIGRYGDENMTIKIFEIIKDLNYGEFACFTQKFKSDTKLKWDQKKMNIANSKLVLSYFRDQKADDKELSEVKAIDYDIKWIQKRTFRTGVDPIENENMTGKEKISFESSFKCNYCGKQSKLTSLIHNFNTITKDDFLVCLKCKKYMEPEIDVIYEKIKNKFTIYSPIKLLSVAKEIFMEYGPRIDLDELRNKYNSFFWNCVFYFFQNGLSIEMMLKYKAKDTLNSNPKKEKEKERITKKKKKVFKILEFQSLIGI